MVFIESEHFVQLGSSGVPMTDDENRILLNNCPTDFFPPYYFLDKLEQTIRKRNNRDEQKVMQIPS